MAQTRRDYEITMIGMYRAGSRSSEWLRAGRGRWRISCSRRCCWRGSWPPRSGRPRCSCRPGPAPGWREPGGHPAGSSWPWSAPWCWPRRWRRAPAARRDRAQPGRRRGGRGVASLIWLPVTRRWSARAHLCWASSVFLFVVYLVFALEWTFDSHLGPGEHGRRRAAVGARGVRRPAVLRLPVGDLRRAGHRALAAADHPVPRRCARAGAASCPLVSLHVPAHNEPPDMVIETLRSLLRLDYPRYEVILHRRQHRRRDAVAPGRGMVRPARRQVRPPGGLAGLQVRAR